MTIRVNGDERTVRKGLNVAELLDELSLNRDGVAVAVNHNVIPRSDHDQYKIPPGANVEVIRAVGGG